MYGFAYFDSFNLFKICMLWGNTQLFAISKLRLIEAGWRFFLKKTDIYIK
jgi:hypothetical protein